MPIQATSIKLNNESQQTNILSADDRADACCLCARGGRNGG